MNIKPSAVPEALAKRAQWCLWKLVERDNDKPTKLPFQTNGKMAKSDDFSTWTTFESAVAAYERGGYSGIGYVFAASDPFVGIDLDGCRDPKTGRYADWARDIITKLGTYAEMSPSETGVKLWLVGKNPFGESGRKAAVPDAEAICDKTPAIEIYDRKRYFAVTGWKLQGVPGTIEENEAAIEWMVEKYFPVVETVTTAAAFTSEAAVIERARKYVLKMPPAISGQGGHNAAFHVACVLVLCFGLPAQAALGLMQEWSQLCTPPWSDRELNHKIAQAGKQSGERNFLRNAKPENWDKKTLPKWEAPAEKSKRQPRTSTLAGAMKRNIDKLREGKVDLVSLGIGELDYAVGGGVEPGELVIMAARPSHGKSALALQCAHHWTSLKKPVLLISEEMSALSLGKRSLQHVSEVEERDWTHSLSQLEADLASYVGNHETTYIVEQCGNCETAIEQIDKHVEEHKIEAVVVDYAQILAGGGKSRYEQMTATSTAMKQVAAKHRLVLILLCQLNREIENRKKFIPMMSDIKESGQFEQDADVILFLVWPHKIDPANPAQEYQIFVAKNRNRAIHRSAVQCVFKPSRQMICEPEVKRNTTFDDWNNQ